MKKLFIYVIILLLISCKTISYNLNPASVIKNGNIRDYQYVFINSTVLLNSGSVVGYDGFITAEDKTVNPKDVIAGCLIRHGFIILNEIPLDKDCLIVTYGESGRRYFPNGAYTTEVSIQFISSKTQSLIVSSTAEGLGSTEVDDIKIAIQRAVDALFQQ